jgi:hypothetical protein
LIGGVVTLVWLAWNLKIQMGAAQKEIASVYAETGRIMGTYQAESKAAVESAKASFSAIRNEVRGLLEEHRKQMQDGIEKINAEALTSVAARLTQVCVRVEKAIAVLQQLIINGEPAPTTEYAPDAYAPEETTFGPPPTGYGLGTTAKLDDEAEREQNQELFTQSPAEV